MRDDHAKKLQELKNFGILLDSKIEGPFGIRFGLDALVGLIPIIGDFSTTLAALYIIAQAANLGCPSSTILRMVLNVAWENIVGAIPFLGNLYDFYWKANNKNVALIEKHLNNPTKTTRQSRVVIFFLFLFLLLLLIGTAYLTILLFGLLLKLINVVGQ